MSKIIVNQIQSSDGTTDVLNSLSAVNVAGAGIGQVLQVVSNSYDEEASTSSTTLTEVVGVSAAITPSSSSSKVLVQIMAAVGTTGNNLVGLGIKRDSTAIAISDEATGSRVNVTGGMYSGSSNSISSTYLTALDSPSTTNEVTYYLTFVARSGYTTYINRTGSNGNQQYTYMPVSTVTLMEIAG